MIKRNQCRERHPDHRLRCGRTENHEGTHRAETGEPYRALPDGSGYLPMVWWA